MLKITLYKSDQFFLILVYSKCQPTCSAAFSHAPHLLQSNSVGINCSSGRLSSLWSTCPLPGAGVKKREGALLLTGGLCTTMAAGPRTSARPLLGDCTPRGAELQQV